MLCLIRLSSCLDQADQMLTVSAPSRTGRRIGFVFDLDADVPWGDRLLMYLTILIMEERSYVKRKLVRLFGGGSTFISTAGANRRSGIRLSDFSASLSSLWLALD
jgi:hypothetical protein